MAGVTIRPGDARDLPSVARIQQASPAATQWPPEDYLAHDFTVALCADQVAGFIVARCLTAGESEILNMAVDPALRRRGIARALVAEIQLRYSGDIYLEVRESNHAARALYQAVGFQVVTIRPEYYQDNRETGIVMKFHSC